MRRLPSLALILALGALGVCACSSGPAEVVCEAPEATTSVELVDFDYVPRCVEASPGDTLTIENAGDAAHTYTVGGADLPMDLQVDVGAGGTAELALEGVVSGTTYSVTCVYHPQMTGALRIV
jgi:plastocyanin